MGLQGMTDLRTLKIDKSSKLNKADNNIAIYNLLLEMSDKEVYSDKVTDLVEKLGKYL